MGGASRSFCISCGILEEMKLPAYATFHTWREMRHAVIVSFLLAFATAGILGAAVMAGADLPKILSGLSISFFRVAIAYFLSLVLAVVIGIAVTRSLRVEAVALPILDVLQSFPNFALLPLVIVWFGAGSLAIITILVVTMVWPILFAIVAGTKAIRSELGEAAWIFGARGRKAIRAFLLPALFPAIVSGSIVGWGEGWEAIVGAEIIARGSGIGNQIAMAVEVGQTNLLFIMLLILMYVIFVVNTWVWLALLRKAAQRSE